ncbi:DUF2252 domain-containing protein [Paucibacter sp. B2R-40]|uniref:DUF2252 domain-containing protein n=1 Tax=Paucibacter sp. B2R-40 TaxID=2893554 RepID=UPI0021E3B39D|nr:DUF2252 domain-containing protein [Paucibacter sp. B2R-40]MCV2354814.1 DUF2252 domain-containing protein [Paucibacter sp. B2R-40]
MALDVMEEISRYNAGRDPERLQMKYQRMRASDFAFLRGSCHLFYARLPSEAVLMGTKTALPQAWACGDLHAENFGSYKGENRLFYFDINDFDEAALAPCSWDALRLLTSIRVGAQGLQLSPAERQALSQAFLDRYAGALREGRALWIERETASGPVDQLLSGLQGRKRLAFLDGRTRMVGKQRLLKLDGKKALTVSADERTAVDAFMRDFAKAQAKPEFFEVLDVGRRIAGTGSLGLPRYVLLVAGKGSPDENYLLDLKLAMPSSLLPHLQGRGPQPDWPSEAERIVATQRSMQAESPAFLQPVQWQGQPFVLRDLQPSEDRIAISADSFKAGEMAAKLAQLMGAMGELLAWAQLRSSGRRGACTADALIEFGRTQSQWQPQLLKAAEVCTEQLGRDAAAFNMAYDGGAFAAEILNLQDRK